MHEATHGLAPSSLAEEVREHTQVSAARCYQCGKCSAGCPLTVEMEYPPSQIMRLLQKKTSENDEKVLKSFSIWLCLTCETCIARCPQEVAIPKVMDYLRQKSLKEGKVNPKAKDILAFHRSFLDSIRATGRLYEMGLIGAYKMRSWHFLQDVLLAPWMFLKGKLHLIPEMIRGRKQLGRIFAKTRSKS